MSEFYYITAASGENFIKNYAQWSLKSLIKCGVSLEDIWCPVNNKKDFNLLKSLIPEMIDKNIPIINEPIDKIKWRSHGGKRRYSVFKVAALYKTFPKPIKGKYMVYFDGDCLFFKDPAPFLRTKYQKTWHQHGKILEDVVVRKSRAGRKMKKSEVNIKDYKSLSMWVSQPAAYLMIKRNAKIIPDREPVCGFYILHPRDHEKLLKMTYENCWMISNKFINHVDVGDQKPYCAAIHTLEIDWHGGSRFECPEHEKYFIHYFGSKQKNKFLKDVKKLEL
jgi:hypothetical protein